MASIPLPGLFGHTVDLMSRILPADTVVMMQLLRVLLAASRTPWLSFGMVGTIWMASTAFGAFIEALDIAYDVKEGRPF